MSQFYDRLSSVIGMMAAIFTVTWMQKNNELLAMMAAGISTQRVIRPVWISAIIVSGIAVANQELVMPEVADELQMDHADDGKAMVEKIYIRYDSNGIILHGKKADRQTKTVLSFNATIPPEIFGETWEIEAKQAVFIPREDPQAPLKGGWVLRGARLKRSADGPKDLKNELIIPLVSTAGFPPPLGAAADLTGESYFLRTDLTFDALTRKRTWYQFAPTWEMIRGLNDPANEPEKMEIAVFLHARILRPALSLTLLFLSLPVVLSGFGRNMFINLGLSLGICAAFYSVCFMAQYLADSGVLSPELATWIPLIGFGSFAVARWDKIRT
jgi:lipopolysaccharide export system permease protein